MLDLFLAVVLFAGPKAEVNVSEADLAALPQVQITIDDHGKPATFDGVALSTLLQRVTEGKEITKYVVVDAADGYRAVFSLAELSPAFTSRRVILATKRDGKPLSEKNGPFQLAAEGEKKMARCVRQVTAIHVVDAPK